MKKLLLSLSFALAGLTSTLLAQICDPSYLYRVPVTISNSGSALSNYQVKLTLNTSSLVSAGKMTAAGNDIRFFNGSCNSIPYYIESGMNTSATTIWVKIASVPNGSSTIYLYYGNPSAGVGSNGGSVFDFWDDFLGSSINTSIWTTYKSVSTTISVSGGLATFNTNGASGDGILLSVSNLSPTLIETNVTAISYSSLNFFTLAALPSSSFSGGINTFLYFTSGFEGYFFGQPTTAGCNSYNFTGGSGYNSSSRGIMGLYWGATNSGTWSGPASGGGPITTTPALPASQKISVGFPCNTASGSVTTIDWVRGRKYAATVPTGSFGTEVINYDLTVDYINTDFSGTHGTSYCGGNYIYVFGKFAFRSLSTNTLYAELSDANGSFSSANLITSFSYANSTQTQTTSGYIWNFNMPNNLPYGTGYRFRWRMSDLAFAGVPSPAFTLGAMPTSSNFSIDDADQCNETDKFTFTASGTIATGNTLVRDWNYGDGYTGTGSPVSHGYASEGSYYVQMKAYNNSLPRCSADVGKYVTVYPQPIAQAYADGNCINAYGNNGTYFYGWYSYDPWSYITNYAWKLGDGNTNTNSDFYHKYATHGDYTVALTVTNAYGCKDTHTFTHTVYPKPKVDFTNTLGCDGDPVQFKDASTINGFKGSTLSNPNGVYSYYIFGDGSLNQYEKNPSHLYSAPGTYSVFHYIESNYGCGDTVRKNVIVNPAPVAKFTASNACLNDIVAIVNNSTISSGSLSYKWNLGDGNFSTTPTPTPSYNTPGGYNIKLYAVAGTGCTDSAEKNITIYGLPTAQFSANEVCAGNATSFTNYSVDATSSFWTFDNGQTSSDTDPKHIFSGDGTFTVYLDVETSNGCKASTKKDVVVNPNPVADFTHSTASECFLDHEYTFTDATTINSGTYSLNWAFGDNTVSSDMNPMKKYGSDGSYNVSVVATSDKGCTDNAIATVNVRPMPVAAFTFNNSCEGSSVPFTNQSTISSGSISNNNWTFGDGGTSTQTNPSRTYANDGNYTVTLQVTSTNYGCKNSVSKTYTAWPNPTVAFTSSNVCFGLANKFTNTSGVGSGFMAAYDWNFGDANTSNEINPSHAYATAGTYNVTLKGTTDKGCFANANGSASVWPQPKADFTVTNVCLGKASVFTNTSTISGGSINTNNWTFGDGGNSTVMSPTHTYNKFGNYTAGLTVISDKSCSSTISKMAQVFRQPIAKIYANPLKTSVLEPEVTFSDNSVFGDFSNWNFGFNGRTSSSSSDTCTYTKPGKYNVRLVSSTVDACTDTANVIVDVVNGYTIFFPTAFTPNADKLNDEFGAVGIFEGITTYELNILDSRGRVVFNTTNIHAKWNGTLENLGEPVPPGNYAWFASYTDFNGKKHAENGVISIRK